MKILLANNYFSSVGGAEMVLYWQYQLLKEKGYEVCIFAHDKEPYFESDDLHPEYFPKIVNYSKLSWFEKMKHTPKRYYNFEAEQKLDKFLKEFRPDIAHFHNIRSGLTPSVLKACYKNNIPVVITLHDASLFCPNAVLRVNTKTYCKEELCVSGNYIHCVLNKCRSNSRLNSLNAACELKMNHIHRLYDEVSAFVTPSKALKKLAVKSGISDKKVKVINNFVDDKFLKLPKNYEKGKYFLYVGRISEEKGLDSVIKAFSKVPSEIKLRIVGTGPEKENLEKLVKESNIDNVEFVGFKSGDELLKEYQNCIATILACDWFENFPTTILESFACSKPVIGSNLGGIPETVIPDKTGVLIEPKNVDNIVNAIEKLYYDENYLKELSIGCKKESERYSKEVYYQELIELYKNVLNIGGDKK